jgi:hypothetical protein
MGCFRLGAPGSGTVIDMEEKGKNLFKKGEEFTSLYRRVEDFTKEILKDNESLRYRMVGLEEENKGLKERMGDTEDMSLVKRVERLEHERDEILHRYKEVEKENIDFAKRYVEIEEENNNLANLYVASYQLHSTLDFKEVLQTVKEIVINLIGSDSFAVYLIDQKTGELSAVANEGLEEEAIPPIKFGTGVIGRNLAEDEGVYVSEKRISESHDIGDPLVSIPLKIKDEPLGAIVILGLLEQKKEFTPLDIELFNLLGGHAATALFASKLFSESKRKLTTIQGFLELLKPDQNVQE